MAESKEELKSLFMKVKEENEKVSLKLNISKTKIMASSPIISWQIDGDIMETVADFIFMGSKISMNSECDGSYKIKKMFAPRKKNYDKPTQHVKRQRQIKNKDITLWTKVHIFKAMAFPVVMNGCESSTIK